MSIAIHDIRDIRIKFSGGGAAILIFETGNGNVEMAFHGNISELLKIKSKEKENEEVCKEDFNRDHVGSKSLGKWR